MDLERWKKIEDIFQGALDLSGDEREKFIAEKTGGDDELRAEVEKLVARFETEDEFLESPVWTDSAVLGNTLKSRVASSIEKELSRNASEKSLTGKKFGVYRLTEQIGKGGMGVVYAAERDDGEFRQKVAVKLIKRGMDTDFIVSRFRHERQILANLNHPNIARLLDGGTTDDGLPYFVMEFIEGEPLLKYFEEKTLDLRQKLKLFLQVCAPIIYAHKRKIIHRDIKPSNILVNEDGEPKLLDFGIAKLLDTDSIHESLLPTATAMRLMTPEYASPEQVRGEEITAASDQYSLGVLLYELITGARPYKFPSRSPHEIARVICEELPIEPSSGSFGKFTKSEINFQSDEEFCKKLDRIVLKTLQKNPSERYESVEEFTADIERFLRNENVRAEAPVKTSDKIPLETNALPIHQTGKVELNKDGENPFAENIIAAPRRKGVKTGIFIIVLSFLLLPFLFLLTLAGKFHPAFFLGGFLLFFLGGIIRVIYALLFEPKTAEAFLPANPTDQIGEAETKLIHSSAPRETIFGNHSTAEKTADTEKSVPVLPPLSSLSASVESRARTAKTKRGFPRALKYALLAAAALVIGFGVYNIATNLTFDLSDTPPNERWRNNFAAQMNARRLTSSGMTIAAAISPDGKRVAFSEREGDSQSLWLRETDAPADQLPRRLVAPSADNFVGINFTPDGNAVFYTIYNPDNAQFALHRVAANADANAEPPRQILSDIGGAVGFAPEGDRAAYFRFDLKAGKMNLLVAALSENGAADEAAAQIVIERKLPGFFTAHPAFSPDGKKIIFAASSLTDGKETTNLFVADLESKTEEQLGATDFNRVTAIAWRAGGDEIVLSGNRRNTEPLQLLLAAFPSGEITRLTNDLSDYSGASLTNDSAVLVTTKKTRESNVATADLTTGKSVGETAFKNLTAGSERRDGMRGISWTRDERIVFTAASGEENTVAVINADGANRQTFNLGDSLPVNPVLIADNRFLFFLDQKEKESALKRYDAATGEINQMSAGLTLSLALSSDNRFVIFSAVSRASRTSLHRVSIEGGDETELTAAACVRAAASPDGRFIACYYKPEQFAGKWRLAVLNSSGGVPIRFLDPPETANLQNAQERPLAWSADNRWIYYLNDKGGISNIFRIRADSGGAPEQITEFSTGRIFEFAVSPDGKRIALARGATSSDIVIFKKSR